MLGALAAPAPDRVRPKARRGKPHNRIIVLELGPNPTTDYYLRPRLAATGLPWSVRDLREPPSDLPQDGVWLIICRYLTHPWSEAIRAWPGLARVSLLVDDDLRSMIRDPALPLAYRAHVARYHDQHIRALCELTDDVWVSTARLRHLYPGATLLPPVPETAYGPVAEPPAGAVCCHLGGTHPLERAFALEVAELVRARDPSITFEMVLNPSPSRLGMNVVRLPELSWPDYRSRARNGSASLMLAPLFPTGVNLARAPVKFFDAARLGAVGVFADLRPFRDFVVHGQDGLLLPMVPAAWADAIVELMAAPERRLALAANARARVDLLHAEAGPLPGAQKASTC